MGGGASIWSGPDGHEVEPGWWRSMSGSPFADYNVLLCYGPDPELVTRSIEVVTASKRPANIMLAGPSLANAQILGDIGWVCIGSAPVMALDGLDAMEFEIDPNVRRAGPDDVESVRNVVSGAYGMDAERARVGIPDDVFDRAGQSVWILSVDGDVRGCQSTVVVGQTLVCWSMAIHPAWQRHGYGRSLMTSVLALNAAEGVTSSIKCTSAAAESLNHSLGFQVIEHWQLWSRPRWALGRN